MRSLSSFLYSLRSKIGTPILTLASITSFLPLRYQAIQVALPALADIVTFYC